MTNIIWNRFSPNPVALILLPWPEGGTTICKLDQDGQFYGQRDVTHGSHHDEIVAAWISDARQCGLRVDDCR